MNAAPTHRAFSPGRIVTMAGNTLLELVRLKVFYFLLVFALLLVGFSLFALNFQIQEQFQMLKDIALGAMSIFTWLLAVLATAMLLPKDIEDRTLYTILAKPVPRLEYLAGKLLGVLALLAIATGVMSLLFSGLLYARQEIAIAEAVQQAGAHASAEQLQAITHKITAQTFTWSLIPGVVTIYLKAALFAALTLLLSTFASSWIFTVVVSVAVYLIGNVQSVVREYWLTEQGTSAVAKIFLALVSLLFPDVQLFNLVDDIVAGNAIALGLFLKTAALGGIYIAVYFTLAYHVFSKKEL
jgi:ABC-type Na+ efflux pump permease subunit